MRGRGRVAGGTLGIVSALAFALPAAAPAVEVLYEVGLYSHYVWRGITLTDDPVLQPSVAISHANGVTLEVWGNVDLGEDNDAPWELTEARIELDWSRQIGAVELGGGVVEYLFPNTPFPGTRELYLHAGYHALLSPRFELHYDVDEIEGGYARLALAYERALGPRWSWSVEASAGYADDAFAIGGQSGWHDGDLELRVDRRSGALALRFLAAWTGSLDPDVLPDQPAGVWGGLSLGYRF